MAKVDVTESTQSALTWSQRDFLDDQWRDAVCAADILLVPTEGVLDRPDLRFFPSATTDLFDFLKAQVPASVRVEVCANDEDYTEVSRQADILYIASTILTTVVVPLFVNLMTEFIKSKMGKREETTKIITSVTVHDAKAGRSVEVNYEGPASELSHAILSAAHQAQQPQLPPPTNITSDARPRTDKKPSKKLSRSRSRRR